MSLDPVLVERLPKRRGYSHPHGRRGVWCPTSDDRRRYASQRAKPSTSESSTARRSFGLSQSLGIDRKEAEQYIRAYFERYSGVRRWLDATIAEVRQTGVARTLLGRERPIPDMHSRNPNARGFAERTAVNTPLQGTAADLIKMAMIRIDKALQGARSRMLLQVHDELVLEAPPDEVDHVRQLVKETMEGVYQLEVPLLVDTGVGPNWRDAK